MVHVTPILMITLCCCGLYGQTRLDSLYAIVRHDSRGDMIQLDGNQIIVVGSARDTSTSAVGISFSRFSLDGELLVRGYEFDSLVYFAVSNELILQDSIAYVAPYMGWSPYYLLKYHRHTGEILEKITIPIIQAGYGFIGPRALDRIDEYRFIFASLLFGDGRFNQTQITIYDMRDGSMRHILNRYSGYHQNVNYISWRDNKIWLVSDLVLGDLNEPGYDARLTIAVLDTFGNEQERYVSPGHRSYTSDCVVEENGDVIVAHNFGENFNTGNGWWVPSYRPGVSKISVDGQIVWERPLGMAHFCTDGFSNFMRTMLPSANKDGYIVAGVQTNFSSEQYWAVPYVDTLPTGENFQSDALISKVAHDGDIVWERTYSNVNQIYSFDQIDDMVYHPEGGYLMSGQVAEYIPGQPLVRTWLLYVDEYGCAVPGCQTVSTADPVSGSVTLMIYPNPASRDLYIYQGDDRSYTYFILDISGKVIEQFKGGNSGHTFILDVSGYPAGSYIVSRQDAQGRLVSEQWIKQ